MSAKRIHRKIERNPDEKRRLQEIRDRFQRERPSPEELLARGDATEFVSLGEYLDLRAAVLALRKRREQMGLSLADLARRSGIDRAAISRLENGIQVNPTVGTLHRYA
ncbi:MAG: helix-turn-helix domain-containing protein, partial [Planctomycetota bacterium]